MVTSHPNEGPHRGGLRAITSDYEGLRGTRKDYEGGEVNH